MRSPSYSATKIIGHEPLVDEGKRYRARCLGESTRGRFSIPELGLECQVAARRYPLRPHRRRVVRERCGGADHVGQRIPFHRDRFGSIARVLCGISHHKGDRIADMAHLLAREDWIGRNGDLGIGYLALARQVAEPGRVIRGERQRHPGHRTRLGDVGDAKACMRVG
jgi:hypothetical protein